MSPKVPARKSRPAIRRTSTITDLLFPWLERTTRDELEKARVKWESVNSRKTDLTKRYTCTWSARDQDRLYAISPEDYFAGLPPYAQDFFREQLQGAATEGRLDDLPSTFVKLFVSGRMSSPGR